MKVLLTGGAGFIGGHTAERLLKRGDDVVIIDNLTTYYDVALKRECLEILNKCGPGKVTFKEVDLVNRDAVRAIFEEHRPDVVCHLAAQAGVRYSIEHVDENVATNIMGTTNILECARDFKPRNVVCASSSSVYGESSVAPFSEDQ
ncbi:unnamed protein product, partial [Polarella glacialis]